MMGSLSMDLLPGYQPPRQAVPRSHGRSYFEIGLFDYQDNGEDLLIGNSVLDLEDRQRPSGRVAFWYPCSSSALSKTINHYQPLTRGYDWYDLLLSTINQGYRLVATHCLSCFRIAG